MEKTTCQICEREIKSKFGVIAHHGYTRPESGWQTNSCIGARNLPYEKSRDLIPYAITRIDKFIGETRGKIKQIEAENLPVPFLNTVISSDKPMYKLRQGEYIAHLNSKIVLAERDRDRLQKRYDNWIRNNLALEGQTPSQIALPNVELTNKNGWLELIQRGYDG